MWNRLHYISADKGTPSLEEFASTLDEFQDHLHLVTELSIVPAAKSKCTSPAITKISLCALNTVLQRLPSLQKLDMECFTWKLCKKPHNCLRGMRQYAFDRLTMRRVRLVGDQSPLVALRFASSVREFKLVDVLPASSPITVKNYARIAAVNPQDLEVQVLLDYRRKYSRWDIRRGMHYDGYRTLVEATRASTTLTRLRVVWALSHPARCT